MAGLAVQSADPASKLLRRFHRYCDPLRTVIPTGVEGPAFCVGYSNGNLPTSAKYFTREKIMRKQIVFLTSLLLAFTVLAACQDKGKRPSPAAHAQCKFSDGKTITIDYSSPRAKGRKIFE